MEIMGAELLKDIRELNSARVNRTIIPEKFKALIGKNVVINGGDWKGYLGVLKSVNDKLARIELCSKMKIVSVDKDLISNPNESSRNDNTYSQTPRNSLKTPAYYPQSPYNNQSPKWNSISTRIFLLK